MAFTPAPHAAPAARRRARARWWRSPAFVVLLIAPFVGESLSTSTPPLTLLRPQNLLLLAGLYGGGAILCREAARRRGLGWPGVLGYGVAFGVVEEAMIVRSWFDPHFRHDPVLDSYGRVAETNLPLALHLTMFHSAISIGCSVLLVELLFPSRRTLPWVRRRGRIWARIGVFGLLPLSLLPGGPFYLAPASSMLAAAGLAVAITVAVPWLTRLGRTAESPPGAVPAPDQHTEHRRFRWLAAAATAWCFLATWTSPALHLPVAVACVGIVAPGVLVGWVVLRKPYRLSDLDRLNLVTGAFWVLFAIDALVAMRGQLDLLAAIFVGGLLLHRARRSAIGEGSSPRD